MFVSFHFSLSSSSFSSYSFYKKISFLQKVILKLRKRFFFHLAPRRRSTIQRKCVSIFFILILVSKYTEHSRSLKTFESFFFIFFFFSLEKKETLNPSKTQRNIIMFKNVQIFMFFFFLLRATV